MLNDYRIYLSDELNMRLQTRASYSQRKFASDLGISSSRLSEILSGRGGMSSKMALKLADALGLRANDQRLSQRTL